MRTLIVSSLLFLMLISCRKSDNATVTTDTIYTFSKGDSKTIPMNSTEVTAVDIKLDSISDRRCHFCENCYSAYGSIAFFLVSLNKGASYDTLTLNTWQCGDADLIKGNPAMDVKKINGINFGLVDILTITENGQPKAFAKIIIYQ